MFLGDIGVGKTSIIRRAAHGKFSATVRSTVGLDYAVAIVHAEGEAVAFQLWDTAGQERWVWPFGLDLSVFDSPSCVCVCVYVFLGSK